jgi:signal transduction histidine kinase
VIIQDISRNVSLSEAYKKFEFIVQSIEGFFTLINRDYRYEFVNSSFCQAHNIPAEKIIGSTVADIWGQETFDLSIKHTLGQAFEGQKATFAGWINFGELGRRYFDIKYHPFWQGNVVTHVAIISMDKTERKLFEEQLIESNKRLEILRNISNKIHSRQSKKEIAHEALSQFKELVPYTQAGILVINPETQEAFVVAKNFDGSSPEDTHSDLFSNVVDKPSAVERIEEWFENETNEDKSLILDSLMVDSGMVSLINLPIMFEGKLIGTIVLGSKNKNAFHTDYIELTKQFSNQLGLAFYNAILFEQLQAKQERLRYFASQLVTAQEDERKRISLERHDQAGQALTALKIQIALMKTELPEELIKLQAKFIEINDLLDTTSNQIRFLARELRPPVLDRIGLGQAIRDYCQQKIRQTGIKIECAVSDLPGLPTHIAISLYRILQEAITNILKHSHARQAKVHLTYAYHIITLRIEDDGGGFDVMHPPNRSQGIGLLGMKERMNAIDGSLEIRSQLGKGTTLTARTRWRNEG